MADASFLQIQSFLQTQDHMECKWPRRKRHGNIPGTRDTGKGRGMGVTITDIELARRTIAGQVLRTPMLPAPKLSALTGAEVFVKYENLQVTNSFKRSEEHTSELQ